MYTQRINTIRQLMSEEQIDGILISNFYNILYLTGCETLSPHEREAFVFITKDNIYFFTDGRYEIAIQEQLQRLKSIVVFKLISAQKKLLDTIVEIVSTEGIKTVCYESNNLTVSEFNQIQARISDVTLKPIEKIISQVRTVKDAEEISSIKQACSITDKCLQEMISVFQIGAKERQIAYLFERWIREHGYEIAFDPMIAFDAHAALPHYNAKQGDGILQKESVILVDFGVRYNGYVSDISRMFFKEIVEQEIEDVYNKLLIAQSNTVQKIGQETTTFAEINEYCRQQMTEQVLPDFSHAVGHGVGLEVHEGPVISAISTEKVLPGHVFTVEPGVYVQGKYGMRIEDTVVIKNNGAVEVLTQFPKTLAVI